MKKGYCHLYFGDGKGKTSILNGMLLRALGENFQTKYYRFMKNWPTAELPIFKKLNVEVVNSYNSGTKFFWEMNDTERKVLKKEVDQGIEALKHDTQSNKYDIIFIDELFSCLDNELIDDQVIIDLVKHKSLKTELVFSAHAVEEAMFQYFDLVSEVKKVKHYYDTIGLLARKGIEY